MITLYTMVWNEEEMLPFFFRHYDSIVDRYIIHDDGSNDAMLALCRAHPKVEIRPLRRTHAESFIASQRDLQDEIWKESRGAADWVIVVDVDEHLYHPDGLQDYLARQKKAGVTAIPGLGYEMVGRSVPAPGQLLAEAVTTGAPARPQSKLAIFNPSAIDETGFTVGRHTADLSGRVKYPRRDELLLLHYKRLAPEYTLRRYRQLRTRLSQSDREQNWCYYYENEARDVEAEFAALEATAVRPMQPGYDPHRAHGGQRWWREPWLLRRLRKRHRLRAAAARLIGWKTF